MRFLWLRTSLPNKFSDQSDRWGSKEHCLDLNSRDLQPDP